MSNKFQIIEADEPIKITSIVVVIYGEPSTGKTSLSMTTKNPILLDFDEGVHRAVNRKTTVKFKSWEEVEELLRSGVIQERKITELVIDTGGVMLDDFIALYAMKMNDQNKQKGGGLSLKGYGAVKDIYSKFQAECRQLGINVIILCHSTDQQENDQIRKRPKMTGGSYDILRQKADLMGFMEMKNNKPVINFNPTDRHVGKNAPGFPEMTIPHYTTDEYKTFLGDIIDKTIDHLNALSEEQRIALQKVEDIKESISAASEIADLAEIETQIGELSKPLQVQLMVLFNEKYAEMWKAKFVDGKASLEEFNECAKLSNQLSVDLQKLVKPYIVEKAKGFNFIPNKATKLFEHAPAETPEPSKEETPAKDAATPKNGTEAKAAAKKTKKDEQAQLALDQNEQK